MTGTEQPATTRLVRPVSGDGQRTLVGDEPLRVAVPDARDQRALVDAVAALVGAPVALLGTVADVLEVEVLGAELRHGLSWCDEPLPEADRPRWGRPGWYASTTDWIDEMLALTGRRRTGPPEQFKHWSISALLRVPTGDTHVWFKQVPDLFAHEGRLTEWIGELAPELVPRVLAHEPGRWLAADLADQVEAEDDLGGYDELVCLQREVLGRGKELLELGCPDRRLLTLPAALTSLAGRDEVLGPERATLLRSAAPLLVGHVAVMDEAGLADTLVHGDFHPGNMRSTADGWRIYDWTDGCLSHPFIDLSPMLGPAHVDHRLVDRAMSLWPGVHREVIGSALIVGTAFQALTYERIADAVTSSARPMWMQEGHGWVDRLVAALTDAGRP